MPQARPTYPRRPLGAASFFVASAALLGSGCYFPGAGLAPPTDQFYYPTGLVVSPGRTTLYVANSDFDLQYNGGTIQAIDLTKLRVSLQGLRGEINASIGELRDIDCSSAHLTAETNFVSPSPCSSIPLTGLIAARATIGAFASGLVLTPKSKTGTSRLFAAVRGDPSITWFDIPDDRDATSTSGGSSSTSSSSSGSTSSSGGSSSSGLSSSSGSSSSSSSGSTSSSSSSSGSSSSSSGAPVFALNCGQQSDDRCDDEHRMGLDPYDNNRGLTLPTEPVGLAASADGTVLVSAHQTTASAGLEANPASPDRPAFQFSLTNLAGGPSEVEAVPPPALWEASNRTVRYQPGFLLTYNQTPEVDLLRYTDDRESSPPRPFLTRAVQAPLIVNAGGQDSRGIAIDGAARKACEDTCGGQIPCLRKCIVDNPLPFYLLNRSPPSIIVGRVRTEVVDSDQGGVAGSALVDNIEILNTVPLAQGPSKVGIGNVIDSSGNLSPRVFAVTFDTHFIYSYDPKAGQIDAVIRTGPGPHGIAFDTGLELDTNGAAQRYSYLYIGHFTDSYLGVVDLDMRNETFGMMFAAVGTPIPPVESKPQ